MSARKRYYHFVVAQLPIFGDYENWFLIFSQSCVAPLPNFPLLPSPRANVWHYSLLTFLESLAS